MVYIYNKLYRPLITDIQAVPRSIRRLAVSLKNKFTKPSHPVKEPSQPSVTSVYPGVNFKNYLNDLHLVSTSAVSTKTALNVSKSIGNYAADVEGNYLLDLYSHKGTNVLGFNSASLTAVTRSSKFHSSFLNTVDLTSSISTEMMSDILAFKDKLKPANLENVHFVDGEAKTVLTHLAAAFGSETVCVDTSVSGSTDFNQSDSSSLLSAVKEHVSSGGLFHCIIKPDFARDPSFYSELTSLLNDHSVPYAIDETETAMLTGKHWAHSDLPLKGSPSAVAFSGATRVSGFFFNNTLNTQLSPSDSTPSASKLRLFLSSLENIEKEDLLSKSIEAGNSLSSLVSQTKHNLVGSGAHFDILCSDSVQAEELHSHLLNKGILTGLRGNRVLIRGSLTLTSQHYALLMRALEQI